MKRIVLMLSVFTVCMLMTVSAYNPYAPNQFDTMDKNTWEYQYVYDLSRDGLTGADMSKFASSYKLTRYEMAQLIAAAKENRSKATALQQEKIDKLSLAFSDDLAYVSSTSPEEVRAQQGQVFDWKGTGR